MTKIELNLLDLPTDILCHCTTFLEMNQMFFIPIICKRMQSITEYPSSFNGEFIMPAVIWTKSSSNMDEICKVLTRFCNTKSIHFKAKHCLSSWSLNLLCNVWSLERRNNIETIYIDHQFDPRYLDLLKSCFPRISRIYLTAIGKNFNNDINDKYYSKFIIPLITKYSSSLIKLNIKFDQMCNTLIIPLKFIKCLKNDMIKLKQVTFGGIIIDLTENENDKQIFINNDNDNTMTLRKIPICVSCLPLNLNINNITELRLDWEICTKCIVNSFIFLNRYFINLQKLKLKFELYPTNQSLSLLKYWMNASLSFNNIYKLEIQLILSRYLWNDNILIVIKSISELIKKILNNNNNNYTKKYQQFKFKISQIDCGNASYLYLFNNILCDEWIKTITKNLNFEKTCIVEIIIDHPLPELIYIDEYHYKPMALKGIFKIFDHISNVKQKEINIRLIFQTDSPFCPSSILCNTQKHQQFYDLLTKYHKNISTQTHIHDGFEWISFNLSNDLIQINKKEQLIFNVTQSTIFEISRDDD